MEAEDSLSFLQKPLILSQINSVHFLILYVSLQDKFRYNVPSKNFSQDVVCISVSHKDILFTVHFILLALIALIIIICVKYKLLISSL